jgi:hypothetical protein
MTKTYHTQPVTEQNPAPWDCDGRTIMYTTPHESDAICMIEVRANVTEDGWNTVAFIEAIWPGAHANARRIVAAVNACEGIATPALEQGVIAELLEALDYLLEQTVDMDLKYGIGLSEGEEDARTKALAVIAKAKGDAQ